IQPEGIPMNRFKKALVMALALLMLAPDNVFASSHREAPISALDRTADVTNYFPFDPNVLYEMKVDNNRDGIEDITFQFRFKTEIRQPGVFTGYVGGIAGIPPITSLDGPGSAGLSLRQSYSVKMVKNGVSTDLTNGQTLYAVPSNVGPRTMPNYSALFRQGIYDLGNGVRTFAGTVDDPFYIDLGAAFDSLNFRMG